MTWQEKILRQFPNKSIEEIAIGIISVLDFAYDPLSEATDPSNMNALIAILTNADEMLLDSLLNDAKFGKYFAIIKIIVGGKNFTDRLVLKLCKLVNENQSPSMLYTLSFMTEIRMLLDRISKISDTSIIEEISKIALARPAILTNENAPPMFKKQIFDSFIDLRNRKRINSEYFTYCVLEKMIQTKQIDDDPLIEIIKKHKLVGLYLIQDRLTVISDYVASFIWNQNIGKIDIRIWHNAPKDIAHKEFERLMKQDFFPYSTAVYFAKRTDSTADQLFQIWEKVKNIRNINLAAGLLDNENCTSDLVEDIICWTCSDKNPSDDILATAKKKIPKKRFQILTEGLKATKMLQL